ncbi:MAG: phosphoadenosine phosphosulfate reductase family protein [Opitutaceae bacterium]
MSARSETVPAPTLPVPTPALPVPETGDGRTIRPEFNNLSLRELGSLSPREIVQWALRQAGGRAVVSTNFRPYEAALLHLVVREQPDIPVLWVDHGYNRPATYRHAEALRQKLGLNLKPYLPRLTAAHRDAIDGPVPTPNDEEALRRFSARMKLEPFQRGMREIAPTVWFTALRRVQNPGRAGFEVVSHDANFGTLKVSPFFHASDAELDAYLSAHNLPNEWDYFDPAKADEKRECGLHAAWGAKAVPA